MPPIKSPAPAEMVAFTNTLAIASDGWAQLAPFGDHPGTALLRQPDGAFQKFPAVQRLDRAAADGMVQKFKSPWHRLKRYFTGCPIYAGHPDVPAFAHEYPDKSSKGMIIDLQVRADGLYCKPVFTNEGSDLVESKKLRAFELNTQSQLSLYERMLELLDQQNHKLGELDRKTTDLTNQIKSLKNP